MRLHVFAMLILAPFTVFSSDSNGGSICIAPVSPKPPQTAAASLAFCHSARWTVRIDESAPRSWPNKESVKVDGLSLVSKHRVVVLCDGKPQQAFSFRFSEYHKEKLCLFLNDLYQTVQLWEAKKSPWCKCN